MAQVLHLTGPVLVGAEDVRPQAWVRRRADHVCRAGRRPRRHDRAGLGAPRPGRRAQPHRPRAHGAVDDATAEEQALADRDAGALLLRDAGSPADTRWVQDREDLPRLVRAGRHIARTRRYIRNYAWEVEPEDLVDAGAARGPAPATAGSSWSATGSTATPATSRPAGRPTSSRRRSRRRTRRAPGSRRTASASSRCATSPRPAPTASSTRRGLDRRHHRVVRRAGHRHRADPGQHRHLPADRRAGGARSSPTTTGTCSTCTSGATRPSRPRTTPASRSTSARMPGARCRTGWSPTEVAQLAHGRALAGRGARRRLLGCPRLARLARAGGGRRGRPRRLPAGPARGPRGAGRARRSSCCAAAPSPDHAPADLAASAEPAARVTVAHSRRDRRARPTPRHRPSHIARHKASVI